MPAQHHKMSGSSLNRLRQAVVRSALSAQHRKIGGCPRNPWHCVHHCIPRMRASFHVALFWLCSSFVRMPRLAARPVSPSAAMACLAFVPSEINERLGTKAKLPRSLDNMEERPYWKWEVGCPHAEDCAKSQNSWSKIWKVSFESPEKLLEKIMWHLHK